MHTRPSSALSRAVFAVALLPLAACNQPSRNPVAPMAVVAPAAETRAASRCVNVSADGTAALGFIPVGDGMTLGAPPAPVVLGGIPGNLGSIVTSLQPSGADAQGAQHITLQHTFESTDPARPGTFVTEDRAVCAPAGVDPNVCRVNNVMRIVSGTGIFANAAGSLRNHGVIDLTAMELTYSLGGRICGDGV